MKPPPLLVFLSVAAGVITLALTAAQRRELNSLRQQGCELQAKANEVGLAASAAPAPANEGHSPSIELLRLRNQVGQLERRKRELAAARPENERLRAQVAAKGTNAASAVPWPAGYLRKADARFAGYKTPEDTLQSLLWAIQQRDATNYVRAFMPEMAIHFEREIQRRASPEEFFKEAEVVPGLRIIRRETATDGTVALVVDLMPAGDFDPQTIRFQQISGQWKLTSGF